MLQITHYGIFDTGTVADCDEQVDRLKAVRKMLNKSASRPCSFGLSGLSRLSGLFGLSR